MAKVLSNDKYYSDIANAIREKNKTTETYKPSEMALAIRAIEERGIPCTLVVETSAGAIITATLGNTTVSVTANANGIATLILNKEGTWNITGTLNGSTKSTAVKVYHEIAEEIDLSNKFYINFLGNIYEYEFESGMTWNDFLLSDYNDNLGAHDVKLGYNVGPATITNALDFFGAPVLTEEFNKEKIDPNIFILPLNPDSANFSPVNGKTYIVHIDTFENVPWAIVSKVSKAGKAQNYWSIGDTKTESSQTYRIIGFDHDDVTDAASYGRSKAGITLQLITIMGTAAWSSSSITTWKNSKIRTNQLPLYMDDLPATFKNYLVPVNKLAANSTSYGTKTTEIVSDTFFLLAINEIQSSYSNAADEGDIYAYYAAGNSKALDSSWWTRSLRKGSSSYRSYIVSINTSGSATQTKYSSTSTGLAWACCI